MFVYPKVSLPRNIRPLCNMHDVLLPRQTRSIVSRFVWLCCAFCFIGAYKLPRDAGSSTSTSMLSIL